ncbi:MAG: D-alanyl-D-alanine carboxypeptidase family protein [Thermodesulfobacteriota bacterium]|nr:D-alanyl-D-alanine carboxypeptidase family protein [Thermodesulfobacteriota bacterium]
MIIRSFKKGWWPILLLTFFLIIFTNQTFSQTTQPSLRINARSAVLMDAPTGQILFEQNPQLKIPPASFVKILTLYVAFDALRSGDLKLNDLVTVSQKAWRIGGSKMFIKVGERVKVEDLIKGIAIVSGNDACVALAEHLAGSEETFILKMNEKAKSLGLKDSLFKNPHGLPAGNQYTTALDMAVLAQRYIEDHPEALTFHSTLEFEHQGIQQQNRNTLLRRDIGVDGLMTGHVEEAGYHLIATGKRGDQRLIAVVMGCESLRKRTREAQSLLEYGFKNFSLVEAVKKGTPLGFVKVKKGKLGKVQFIASGDGRVTVAKGKEDSITLTSEVPEFIMAPVQKGQVVGKVLIQSEGRVLKEVALLSSSDVSKGIFIPWPIIGGGILGLIILSLFGFWWIRRSQRKRFQ